MLGQPDATAAEFAALGADVVKIQLYWDDVAPPGRRKPAGFDASQPVELPLGHLSRCDQRDHRRGHAALREHRRARAKMGDATGEGEPAPGAPARRSSVSSRRPSGRQFPNVHIWSIWNEPNLYSWLSPQRKGGVPQSPSIYRRLYLAGHAALRRHRPRQRQDPARRADAARRNLVPKAPPARVPARDGVPRQQLSPVPRPGGPRTRMRAGRPHPDLRARLPPVHAARRPRDPRRSRRRRDRRARARHEDARRARPTGQAPAQAAALDHRVRLPDESARPLLRRDAEARAAFMDASEFIAFRDPRIASYSQYTLKDDPPRPSGGRPFQRWSTLAVRAAVRQRKGEAVRVRSVPPAVPGALARPGCGRAVRRRAHRRRAVATIEAKAPGGRYRSIASLPVNENGYFRQIVRLKKAYRHKFRVRLGGLSRTKRSTVVL